MKKKFSTILSMLLVMTLCSAPAFGFLYDIKILSKEEIKSLSDTQIAEVYTEAKIEDKAAQEFHESAGFSSGKDYTKRKSLLRFLVNLRKEMSVRGLEIDPIDEWLN